MPTNTYAARLIVVAATILMGACSAWALSGSVVRAAIGGGAGLAWGVLLCVAARWFDKAESPFFANAALFPACLVSGMLLGVALFSLTLLSTVIAASPELLPAILRPPLADRLNIYFIVFNTLLEWLLLPAALLLNWHSPGRRGLLIAAALAFYGMRVWTYLYFVPSILAWGSSLQQPVLPETLALISRWADLSWFRLTINGLVNVLLLMAAFVVPSVRGGSRQSPFGDHHTPGTSR